MTDSAVFHDSVTDDFRDAAGAITAFPGAGGGGVDSIEADGAGQLTGDVTLSEGTGITLTTAGNDIAIGATPLPGGSVKLYDYEVTGSDKATIDTAVDGTTVADFAGYDVLEIWVYARTDEAVTLSTMLVTLNNDGSSIYDQVFFADTNTTLTGGNILANAGAWQMNVAGDSCAAGVFSCTRITMPNYLGTVGNKFGELTGGVINTAAASAQITARQLGYRSTTAVSRLKISVQTAAKKFKIGTRIVVYGR